MLWEGGVLHIGRSRLLDTERRKLDAGMRPSGERHNSGTVKAMDGDTGEVWKEGVQVGVGDSVLACRDSKGELDFKKADPQIFMEVWELEFVSMNRIWASLIVTVLHCWTGRSGPQCGP